MSLRSEWITHVPLIHYYPSDFGSLTLILEMPKDYTLVSQHTLCVLDQSGMLNLLCEHVYSLLKLPVIQGLEDTHSLER